MKAGDHVKVPMLATKLSEAKPADWCEAVLLRFDEGGAMLYPTRGEPYPRAPSWQVRIVDERAQHWNQFLVSVELDCIQPL